MRFLENLKKKRQIKALLKEYDKFVGRTDEVAKTQAEYFAILLDEMKVWEYTDSIPSLSRYVPCVDPRKRINHFSYCLLSTRYKRLKRDGDYDRLPNKPYPMSDAIGYKDAKTGYLSLGET